jgi:phage baseplate assembly protein gpV
VPQELDKEALVECQSCRRTKWVPWEKRHSGGQKVPNGIDEDVLIRCINCSGEKGCVVFTGQMRLVKET